MLSVRQWLFEATADLHDRVDQHASRYALGCPQDVARFLAFIAEGIGAVEAGLNAKAGADEASASAVQSVTLRPELAAFQRIPRPPVDFGDEAEVWGGLYTLEGAKLGARVLARKHPLLGNAEGFDADAPTGWPLFLKKLELADARLLDRDGMVAGAGKAFGAFIAMIDERFEGDLDGSGASSSLSARPIAEARS